MLRYMVTPPALRLDDDDTATDDVFTICSQRYSNMISDQSLLSAYPAVCGMQREI